MIGNDLRGEAKQSKCPNVSRRWKIAVITVLVVLCIAVIGVIIAAAIVTRTPNATLGPPITSSLADNFRGDKVVVIGGGAAGLFAAYTLAYLGVDFQLLEASDGFGGRVQELPAGAFADVPIDLGAEWIHVNPKVLQDLLLFDDEVDVRTIVYQPQTIATHPRNKRRSMNWFRFFYREHKFYNTTWWSYLDEYVYPYVADRVELNAVVTSIDFRDANQVTVQTSDGQQFTGSHVIVATPVSVLQDGDIEFSPGLPDPKLRALGDVYMTAGLKAWVEFDERFYPDVQMAGDLASFLSDDSPVYFDAVFRKPSNKNILALFQVGGQSGTYDRVKLTDEAILQSVMQELDEIFDGKATEHYVMSYVQNWSSQPHIKGAYSYNDYDMAQLIQPIDSRIYFCGEYLNYDDQATVHGAAISGQDTVRRLVLDSSLEL